MQKLKITYIPINRLKPDNQNPRNITGQSLERLQRSLREFGFVDPVIARRKDHKVIGGHQRLAAAQADGETEVPVIFIDISDERLKLLNVALNNPNLQGEFDWKELTRYLDGLEDIQLAGFDQAEFETFVRNLAVSDDFFADDAVDELVEQKNGQQQITFLFTKTQIQPVNKAIKQLGKQEVTQEISQLCQKLAA